jgi:hypothetical protein
MSGEPEIVIENRKELTYLLCLAAELEHALMCEYLYAAFSLKTAPDDGLDAERIETVERWRSAILRVATEEMLHWGLVNNLLTAVGSAPYVARPHLPHQAKGYPAGVQIALVGFGERALRHFLYLERPEGMEMEDAEGFEATGPALPIMSPTDIIPRAQEFSTVSHLYRSIEAGLENLAKKFGEDMLFIGPRRAQATGATFGWPELVAIDNLEVAKAAIQRIVEQGEGARGDWSEAHYGRFLAILEEYLELRRTDPEFEPAHAVVPGAVRAVDDTVPDVWITDPVTAAVTDLFNAVYDLILQMVVRGFAFGEETDEQLRALFSAAVGLMFVAIKPLGLLLATLPIGPEHPGVNAGANFQLAYRSSFLLPHRRAAWIRFSERLDEMANFADGIDAPPEVRTVLDQVGGQLRGVMGRMAPHID